MTGDFKEKILDKVVRALLLLSAPDGREQPPEPTKEDLERKFVMRLDRKGRPTIREISD